MTLRLRLPEGMDLVPEGHPALVRALGLFEAVIEAAPEPTFPLHVQVGVPDTDRAIAQVQGRADTPGEVVLLVSRGLLDALGDREVQSLLAHELGHVHGRHLRSNREFLAAWVLATVGGTAAMAVASWAGVSPPAASWVGVGMGLAVLLLGRPWLRGVIQGNDEFAADRFSARVVGARAAVRTIRRAEPLFEPKARPSRGWRVGLEPPPNRWRVGRLYRARHRLAPARLS